MPEFLQPFVGTLSAHPYLFMFIGMLFVGELVLLPAIYLSITGRLELVVVIGIAIVATLVKDLVWYYAGRRFPSSALSRLPGRGTSKLVRGLSALFLHQGAQVVFLSKFVYGTRTATQILAGVHDLPFRVYMVANTLGVTALTLVLSSIAWVVAGTTQRYADVVHSMEVAFGAFVLVAVVGYVSVAHVARRRWSQ